MIRATDLHSVVPDGQWQIVDVSFTAANADVQIAHTLSPADPADVEYSVIRLNAAAVVYEDQSASRQHWADGFIVLRASAICKARLLLRVLKTPITPQF